MIYPYYVRSHTENFPTPTHAGHLQEMLSLRIGKLLAMCELL